MSNDMVYEKVPRLLRRIGDNLVAGANNAAILLGRDRIDTVSSGYGRIDAPGKGVDTGAIHLMVGRKSENPSISDDSATVFISSKTDVDNAAGTTGVGSSQSAKSAIIMRADCIRFAPRTDFKISVGKSYIAMSADGSITIEGNISLGENAAYSIILGDLFKIAYETHSHIVPIVTGPVASGPPIVPLTPSMFSSKNKVG